MQPSRPIKSCILIPLRGVNELVVKCLASIQQHAPHCRVVIVDDGSEPAFESDDRIREFIAEDRTVVLRHDINRGPAAARNTGIRWCRENDVEVIILVDSDCEITDGFVPAHEWLHHRHREATCIGGAIEGVGRGAWAKIDGVMSWFTSLPEAPPRTVSGVYHIPTTNMSLKTADLPDREEVFSERLRTGEDVAFVYELQRSGRQIRFDPTPMVLHHDRNSLTAVLRHQYRWALHTYCVRFSGRGWGNARRLIFALAFALGIPAFAVMSTTLNVVPWLRRSPWCLAYVPVMLLIYAYKGVGVLIGILRPDLALYPDRDRSGL